MTEKTKSGRRRFLLGGLGISGALILGWGVLPPRQRLKGSQTLPVHEGEIALNGWIRIAADGQVGVAMHRSEMGQGIHTALQMLVAEELDVPLSSVTPFAAPVDKIYGNMAMLADGLPFHPDDDGVLKRVAQWMTLKTARELGLQVTGGSSSVKDAWQPLREAGATARAMLLAAAAQRWQVQPGECTTQAGQVLHSSGKQLRYGELAATAVNMQPSHIQLKKPADFRLIGTPQPRREAGLKVNGKAQFGIDARPPGLLYAALSLTPVIGGKPKSWNSKAVLAKPGVKQVVDLTTAAGEHGYAGLAVVADSYWAALQALPALATEWDAGPHNQLSSAKVFAELAEKLEQESGFTYYERGDVAAGFASKQVAKMITAEYRAPFLAHAAMEPINCTAQWKDGQLDLWASTQVPSVAVAVAASMLNIASEKVQLHMCYLGGGFGRRLEVDMIRQAVAIARQTEGRPVKLVWSREEDTAHDMYRPAALARFTAALDAQGQVLAYLNRSASGSVTHQVLQRSFGVPGAGPDKTTAEGEFDHAYALPHQKTSHVIVPTPVPLGYWRSVGHSHNAFFKESFMDELAAAAQQSPLEFRRQLLAQQPRHLAVLNAAVEKAGAVPAGRAHGLAIHRSFGSIVAQVVEVSIEAKQIKVHKVVCAIDCGIAVNPAGIAQQMESAVIFALSAALYGEITIEQGRVMQSNFHDYAVLRMNEAPLVETVIIPSAEAPEGVGEPGVPPLAPALASAVFQLTGQRLRSLPLKLG
ncbi:xanthine dehydrogenase family protein molybdopterin-binding subunit [Undibacterium rugosum]|uniref:xanthine dehydrogenase family protein molybdopterin-binding subunit n=1 Tax=Undibacterium rugosum TaxID=2762291 RepID=UPI001B81770E|nr:molybdopterin cofactor-binding domain-containing protein [Undibacterium rugosum]MBR7778163.1 xanthine dehydrogenase family protein molybdopterin-binding subunit [Undibacterium rugosum]